MPRLNIAVEYILTDPDHPEDLSKLPPSDAADRIRQLYSFLSSIESVSVEGGIATIVIGQDSPYREDEALRTAKTAGRAAERGNYQAAIEMFEEALEVVPYHAGTRRDLGMAFMEIGDAQAAKRHIIEALRLDPMDVWSYVILGNIYLKMQQDPAGAERWYSKAYQLDPTDLYVLNSLGTLKAKAGDYAEARSLFEQAIEQDPNYPNPRYGLAMCYDKEGDLETAALVLEETCSTARTQDVRTDPVYRQAQRLYLDVNRRLAQQSQRQMLEQLRAEMDDFGERTGLPIELQEDAGLQVLATTQLAWIYGRQKHVIRHQPGEPEMLPHWIAHQFELIRLNWRAREAGRAKLFTSSTAQNQYALRIARKDAGSLRRRGLDETAVDQFLTQIVDGLLSQLFNAPLEMIAEYRLHTQFAWLRPSQVISLHLTHQRNVRAFQDESIREATPRIIWEANVAMNCAYALFTDFLFNNATAHAEPYHGSHVYSTGRRLFDLWKSAHPTFDPGDEYDLVDQFAQALKLERWYGWQPVSEAGPAPEPTPEGTTDPDLLKSKEPASVMYLLDALQRFDGMDDTRVREIAFEIALLGRSGLDYASSEKKYRLQSLPGEQFSGLHLMCLMFVGFKRIDPTVDIGMDLDEAYQTALAMHNRSN